MGHFQIRICAAARCPYGFSTADISAWGNDYRWWCHTTVHAAQFTLQSFLEMSCGIILVVLVAWMHSGGIFSHGEATKYFLVHAPCKISQLSFQTSCRRLRAENVCITFLKWQRLNTSTVNGSKQFVWSWNILYWIDPFEASLMSLGQSLPICGGTGDGFNKTQKIPINWIKTWSLGSNHLGADAASIDRLSKGFAPTG